MHNVVSSYSSHPSPILYKYNTKICSIYKFCSGSKWFIQKTNNFKGDTNAFSEQSDNFVPLNNPK